MWASKLLGIQLTDSTLSDIDLHCRLTNLSLEKGRIQKASRLIAELSKYDEYVEQTTLFKKRLLAAQNAIIQSEELAKTVMLTEIYLRDDKLKEALGLIAKLKASPEYKEKGATLEQQAAVLKKNQDHLRALQADLCNGKLTTDSAKELVRIYKDKQQLNALLTLTENTLQPEAALPAGACLNVARIYLILKKNTHAKVALGHFGLRSKGQGTEKDFLEATALYYAIKEPLHGAKLLKSYTAKVPTSTAAWYELAAIQAEAGDTKSALSNLRNAVKQGGNPTRQKAKEDKRFSSVKETWTFGRLVKPE